MKLLVVGWDAATQKHLNEFDVPYWEQLEHSGLLLPEELFYGTYISTGNAWTTMTTGATFEQHRIYSFVHGPYTGHPVAGQLQWLINRPWIPRLARRILIGFVLGNVATEGGRGASPQSTDVPFKRVWEYLPGESLIFGLPVTYPVWKTNGVLVAGIPAPEPADATSPLVHPLSLSGRVFDDFSGYHVDITSPIHDDSVSEARFCKAHEEKTETIADKFIDLYTSRDGRDDFEFGFVMLRSIDDVLHATTDRELQRRIYRKTGEETERIVDEIDPDAVLVLSDHGMRQVSPIRKEKHIKMDHDTTQGVWGATESFDLGRHVDVTPAILDYFDTNEVPPQEREEYEVIRERVDEEAVYQQLSDLGYI